MTEPRFFVAGATGYTGREVVRLARERGIETVAHVRPDSRELARWRERFEALGAQIDATPWDERAMSETVARHGPSQVFALLGTTRTRARDEKRETGRDAGYEAIDYGLTMLLYRAVAASAPAARFIYLSSAGVGEREPRNAYLQARFRMERALNAGALPFTIARPSIITGPDRDEPRRGEQIGAAVATAALALAGALGARKLRDRYRPVSNSELAAALIRLALDPFAEGATVESEDLHRP